MGDAFAYHALSRRVTDLEATLTATLERLVKVAEIMLEQNRTIKDLRRASIQDHTTIVTLNRRVTECRFPPPVKDTSIEIKSVEGMLYVSECGQ